MGADTSITITGTIRSEEDLEKLLDAICKDCPETEWSEVTNWGDEEYRQYVVEAIQSGEALEFMETDRRHSEFPRIEAICQVIGLSYVLDVDVEEGYSDPGSKQVWAPGMDIPLLFTGSAHGGGTLVDPKVLQPLIKAGNWAEVERIVDLAVDPAAGLPKTLSAAFDLELATAATP